MTDSYGPEGVFLAEEGKSFKPQGIEIVAQRKVRVGMFSWDLGGLDVA